METKPNIRIPVAYTTAEIGLDEFTTDEIQKYLRDVGADTDDEDGLWISDDDMGEIERLGLIGQRDTAIAMVVGMIETKIGRKL